MAFDQATRNRLNRFVGDARSLLTLEFTRQLQNDYGIDPEQGIIKPIEDLSSLDDVSMSTARILRQTFEHYQAGSPSETTKNLLNRIVREQAFTILNRFVALRMAEARGILTESISKGYQSQGFQLYSHLAGSGLGETYEAYKCYLLSIFDEFALDLAVLFDRFSPSGRLFPRKKALDDLLTLINEEEIESLWAEDETIGWIYQYFNTQEERKKMRKESSAPRNSRELAVRNQFFTPRYVVEFLTDNTLGRTWYEMTRGQTALAEDCRYLVRRPNEVFLNKGEDAPDLSEPGAVATGLNSEQTENLSQEELLKQTVYIPHRPLKDPREILMLDPACGSMHFGLYAFDLFLKIYEEAWNMSEPGAIATGLKTLHETYDNDKERFLQDVPRLIIEHNIHGVDIDPRAVQIAGLSLWLRAQRAWAEQNIRPAMRPQIRRSNIVCAEPMPGDVGLLEEFIGKHFSETSEQLLLGEFVRRIFDSMKLAGEAGSLLKIEEEVANLIKESQEQWQKFQDNKEGYLFDGARTNLQQGFDFDVGDITDKNFWDRAEDEIYKALRRYAESGEDGTGFGRRLFADDTAQGFAFIDLCRKKYDAVVMNPPFGEQPPKIQGLLEADYETANGEFGLGFIERFSSSGLLGSVLPRPVLLRKRFTPFRRQYVGSLLYGLDLGWGVLDDAQLEVTAQIYCKAGTREFAFIDAYVDPLDTKDAVVASALSAIRTGEYSDRFHTQKNRFVALFPNSAIVYRIPRDLLSWFELDRLATFGPCLRGLQPPKSEAYFFAWFEVPCSKSEMWKPICNGGGYSPFFMDNPLVTRWGEAGRLVTEHPKGSASNSSHYFNAGLSWSKRSERIHFSALPSGHIFTHEGHEAIVDQEHRWWLLAVLNSRSVGFVMNTFCGLHKQAGYVRELPIPSLETTEQELCGSIAKRLWIEILKLHHQSEVSKYFVQPSLRLDAETPKTDEVFSESTQSIDEIVEDSGGLSLETRDLLSRYWSGQVSLENADGEDDTSDQATGGENVAVIAHVPVWMREGFAPNSATVLCSYCVGIAFGRWDVRYATGERQPPELPDPFNPLPVCPPGMLQNAEGLPAEAKDVPEDYPIDIVWNGILVDDAGHPANIETKLREVLRIIWKENAEDIEQEGCEILKVKSLRDYFRKPLGFFADHLKRYSKSRRQAPIYLPLSTKSGDYTLWLYYHRLNDQTLYTCVNDYVEPKMVEVKDELTNLRVKTNRTKDDEKRLEYLDNFESELREFRDELLRLAQLPWKPNLNDGVQITMCPLWNLFGLTKWRKTLEATWKKLEKGDYDWAHLAYTLYPDRVREKCVKDKSLAIAHDLEELYIEPPPKKGKRKKKVKTKKSGSKMFDDS